MCLLLAQSRINELVTDLLTSCKQSNWGKITTPITFDKNVTAL